VTFDPVEFLRGMVEIESFSGDEGRVATWIVARMADSGFDARVDEAGNAVGVLEGPPREDGVVEDVVLLGHIDTVPGRIEVRMENGCLYGRGSVDAKGPFATFVAAALRAALTPGIRLHVIGAVEEESATSKGARAVAPTLAPSLCLIGEPSGAGALTLGYKGRVLVDVSMVQDGGHSAGPIGSVGERACAFWARVERHAATYNDGLDALFDRLMPSLRSIRTTSDGLVDEAHVTLGFRLPQSFDVDALIATLSSFDPDARLRSYGAEEAWSDDRRSPWARAFIRAWRRRDRTPRFKRKTGTADLNVLGPIWRCPIAAYGPGDSTLDHTPNEHLEIAEYLDAIDVLTEVLSTVVCMSPVGATNGSAAS